MFVMYGFSKIQIVCVTLAAVGWWLKAISIHKSNFQIQLNKAGWLILFLVVSLIQIVCAALAAVCWCLRAINFAQFFYFCITIYEAGWLFPCFICCFLYDASCLCHSGSCLLVLKSYPCTKHFVSKYHVCSWLAVSVWHLLLPVLQAICVSLAAVCWCLRATNSHIITFPNLILSSWVLASICHALFSLRLNLFPPSWELSAGA